MSTRNLGKQFAPITQLGSKPMPSLEGHYLNIWDGLSTARPRPVRLDAGNVHSGGQTQYDPRMVGKYVARPDRPSNSALASSVESPAMVRKGGEHWITDGHHRVLAAKARGESEVNARVYDLDAGRWV